MTTLTINLPEDSLSTISDISVLVKKAGGNISIYSDDDLSDNEMELLTESYKEALLIRDGKIKGIPPSELWND